MKNHLKAYGLLFILSLITIGGCKQSRTGIDWKELERGYATDPGDSLRLQALLFLKENIRDMTSEVIVLRDTVGGMVLNLHDLDPLGFNEDTLRYLISKRGFKVERKEVADEMLMSTQTLKHKIEEAFAAWRSTPWYADIPKDIFFEYLLPYKIWGEYPGEWRRVLQEELSSDLNNWSDTVDLHYRGLEKVAYIDSLVNGVIVPGHNKWYTYSLNSIKLGSVPSFSELAIVKGGDCFNEAAIDAYLFKAAGIPAGYDVIPYWGNTNGTHATAVYYNPDQRKMRLIIGFPYSPAKVFRRTFSRQNVWSDQILPALDGREFHIGFLKSDRLSDVTHEHVATSDIDVELPFLTSAPVAYITILSYGKWVPIFWGSIRDGNATFRNMGKNVIYRVAIPTEQGDMAFGKPFLFTNDENYEYPEVYDGSHKVLSLTSINHGKEAYVRSGRSYILYYMDPNGEWIPVEQRECAENGLLTFGNVRQAMFYKLVDPEEKKDLSRMFAISRGKQIWY